MKTVLAALIALAALSGTARQQVFTGVITDDMCARGDHAGMRMGPTSADCTVACVLAHDAMYVLFDGTDAWVLSDQKTPERFAGQAVRVTGTLDASRRRIVVESITAAD